MNATAKRLISLALVLMLVFSLSIPAFAATKPSATHRYSTSQYVRRGNSYLITFNLRSGSYTAQKGYYRARFDTDMYKYSDSKHVGYTAFVYFTGNLSHSIRWTFTPSVYSRNTWYKLRYRTQYRKTWNGSTWYTGTSKYMYFYVQ